MLAPFFENLDPEHVSAHVPNSRGERILDLHERVREVLVSIVGALDQEPEEPRALLICTHAATMIAIGRILTGRVPEDLDEDDFQCYTASLSKFVRKGTEEEKVFGGWDCVLNAETGYLSGGAERGW